MNGAFWRDRRVLVTGHTGFKGAWLTLWLRRLGASVTGVALDPPTSPSLFELAGVAGDADDLRADLAVPGAAAAALARARPEVVLHLAAQSLVRASYARPAETFATNVMGTVQVLDACRACPTVRVAVVVTSDKVYEEADRPDGHGEDDALGGHDPYSASKACAELVASSYRRSFLGRARENGPPVAVATARAGNVIGGGDWAADRLVPDLVRALVRGETPVLRYPGAVRPWQHVLEPLSGYLRLAEALWTDGERAAGAWNFGPPAGAAWPVSRVADEVCRLWGGDARWSRAEGPQPHERQGLRLDSRRAIARLRWRPRTTVEQALALTVRWYRVWAAGGDLRRRTRDDLEEFEAFGGPGAGT